MMSGLLRDVRDGFRAMRRSPAATAVSIAILGLAIAANAVILTVAETVFYRPLPVPAADRLARIARFENGREAGGFSYPEYRDLRDHAPGWESVAAHYSYAPLVVDAPGGAREVQGAVVTANYFATLGVLPAAGRFFRADEDAVPDRDRVAVLGERFWRARFGGDPALLGRAIRINGLPFTVVGVAPADFAGVHPETPDELWIPTMMLRVGYRWGDALDGPSSPLEILGRLAPGTSLETARAGFAALRAGPPAPPGGPPSRFVAEPARGVDPAERRSLLPSVRLLAAIALLLLVVSCANVAGVQGVRATARRREIAIRRSLGCAPARLVRKLLVESLLIAAAGGAAGIFLSVPARAAVLPFYTADSEGYVRTFPVSLSPRVWLVSLALALAGGLLCGAFPAFQAARSSVIDALKDARGWTGAGERRDRTILVAAQISLSFALVAAAGLLSRSASSIRTDRFDPSRVALMRLRPRLIDAPPERAERYTREVLRRLEATPGVESASLVRGSGLAWRETGEARIALPSAPNASGQRAGYHEVGPRFLATLGIPLLRGREFDSRDRAGSPPVALVNASLAGEIWPGGDPLGRTILVDGLPFSVVGVFRDAQLRPASRASAPFVYLAYWQFPFGHPVDSRLVIRTAGDPKAMLEPLRKAAIAVDPEIPVTELMAMSDQVSSSFSSVFLAARVAGWAGAVAVLLAAFGIYGLFSAVLLRRRPEFALRMALGATGSDIRGMVLRDAARLFGAGSAAGLAAAFALTPAMGAFLFATATLDVGAVASAAAVLGAAVLLACWPPARRASRIDPAAALRAE